MAKMVGAQGLSAIQYDSKTHARNEDGDFDIPDDDVEHVSKNFGLVPKDPALAAASKKS